MATKEELRETVFRQNTLTGAVLRGISRNTSQKNIDGYALDGQLDNDTGRPLKDTAAAVTAWASTWRIPQFKTVGLPTMGAYRELRKLPRGVSIADEFDERVEAARAAADSGDFALYISAQGGANVPRDRQTVRVARSPSDDVNEYEEEVESDRHLRAASRRVIFISPERRTGALCRKFRSLSL